MLSQSGPHTHDRGNECNCSLDGYVKLVSVASVVALTLLNWLGLRAGSRIQELTSLVKALALIAFVVACFVISPLGASKAAVPASLAAPKGGLLLSVLLALQAVIVTYDGWYFAIYFTEEEIRIRRETCHDHPLLGSWLALLYTCF